MARCKMDQPERAAYLRVFCAHLLTDEDFETLTREEMGSACLLMFHAWTKQGSLPNDERKLAALARCSVEEFRSFREAWPKLVPLERLEPSAEPGARVTIPYLWREWVSVMGFYEDQKKKSAAGVAARKIAATGGTPLPLEDLEEPAGQPVGKPAGEPTGQPTGVPNQDQDQDQDQDQAKRKALSPTDVVEIWNEATKGKLPKARLTPKREGVIRTRIREKGWVEDFRKACTFLAGSLWHHGKNDRGWVATIDYSLQAGKATELAEKAAAGIGGRSRSSPAHRANVDEELKAQLREEHDASAQGNRIEDLSHGGGDGLDALLEVRA